MVVEALAALPFYPGRFVLHVNLCVHVCWGAGDIFECKQ